MDEVANPTLAFETLVSEKTELVGPVTASLVFSRSEIDSTRSHTSRASRQLGPLHTLSMGSIPPVYRRMGLLHELVSG